MNGTMEINDDIATRVLDLLGRKIGAGRPIGLDSSVIADTGLDSVSVMDFVMERQRENLREKRHTDEDEGTIMMSPRR